MDGMDAGVAARPRIMCKCANTQFQWPISNASAHFPRALIGHWVLGLDTFTFAHFYCAVASAYPANSA